MTVEAPARGDGVRVDSSARDLESALRALRADGVRSLFVEGGAGLAGSLLRESARGPPHYLSLTVLLGSAALHAFRDAPPGFEASLERHAVVERRQFGDDQMTTYALRDVPCSPD